MIIKHKSSNFANENKILYVMPFYSGDKEYSDQQVAAKVKRLKQERHDWCEQQAREYLAAHERPKYK